MPPAISVEGLGKQYRLGALHQALNYDTLRDRLAASVRTIARRIRLVGEDGPPAVPTVLPASECSHLPEFSTGCFWALKDVSFAVQPGEVVGVIGRNGAGKSTLLKILSRIVEPTAGRATLHGRLGSLLEVGTGFHPELTGRENIFLNGAILGMSRREIRQKFDEIVAFSEIETFLDTPVKRYSSGMYVRLAFAVAAHLDPEILMVDEVLAVGDMGFQRKCLGKMSQAGCSGSTVLFVSHQLGIVADLCTRVLLIEKGRLVADGPPSVVIARYTAADSPVAHVSIPEQHPGRTGSGPMRLRQIATFDRDGSISSCFAFADTIRIRLSVECDRDREILVGISFRTAAGQLIYHLTNTDDGATLSTAAGLFEFETTIPAINLNDGEYGITTWIGDSCNRLHDRVENAITIRVDSRSMGSIRCQAPVRMKALWSELTRSPP